MLFAPSWVMSNLKGYKHVQYIHLTMLACHANLSCGPLGKTLFPFSIAIDIQKGFKNKWYQSRQSV